MYEWVKGVALVFITMQALAGITLGMVLGFEIRKNGKEHKVPLWVGNAAITATSFGALFVLAWLLAGAVNAA